MFTLGRLLGKDAVFMDVDSIALGRDFRQVLQERLNSCDVMVALIGPGWLDARDAGGKRRIDSATDYVRQEISAALKRNIPVVPVLLQGAPVPQPEQLPADLQELSYRNAFELGHSTWESDVREMVRRIGLMPAGASDPQPATAVETSHTEPAALRMSWSAPRTAAVVVSIVLAAALIAYFTFRGNAESTGETGTAVSETGDGAVSGASFSDVGGNATTSSTPSGETGTTPLPTPAAAPGGGLAGSGVEFAWPGDDCWDVLRGNEVVIYQCGVKKQALGAGRYTVKARHAPVFMPFEIDVRDGQLTRVVKGGVFRYAWPGDDCWDIVRDGEVVVYQCGNKQQALGAGRYTIKGRFGPVFDPFDITIADGAIVRKP